MRIILFGATGMVGQGVLRECLLDPEVHAVLSIGRSATGQTHAKLRELVHRDFLEFSTIETELRGFDACFFCFGVSSVGMSEEAYRRVTFDITLAAAQTLAGRNPAMTFIYVSGAGTDSSELGRRMWARVKGQTENALLRLPLKAAVMFRPAGIVPLPGVTSKTRLYRTLYVLTRPLWSVLHEAFPQLTWDEVDLAGDMIRLIHALEDDRGSVGIFVTYGRRGQTARAR